MVPLFSAAILRQCQACGHGHGMHLEGVKKVLRELCGENVTKWSTHAWNNLGDVIIDDTLLWVEGRHHLRILDVVSASHLWRPHELACKDHVFLFASAMTRSIALSSAALLLTPPQAPIRINICQSF